MIEKGNVIGLAIGVICPYTVPIKWMMHMMHKVNTFPGGLYWSYIYTCGDFEREKNKNYASLRKEIVQQARDKDAKYLFFLDSDVFIPDDAVTRLMSHEVDIVTGVYWMKTEHPQPVIYKEIGAGPLWNIKPQEELLEIGGAGLGCCLIKMSVFDKFDEEGVDWFNQDWEHIKENARITVAVGEDHWFYSKAKDLGFKIWCDTNIMCDHYDIKTDKFYPDQKVVRKIAKEKLNDNGQQEVITHQDQVRSIEVGRPTIVFWAPSGVAFDGDSINNKPISGSETAVINMAREMRDRHWNSHVFCPTIKNGFFDGVGYYNCTEINKGLKDIAEETERKIDVFISNRDLKPFIGGKPPANKTVLWMHDMPFCVGFDQLPEALENIDNVFFVSEFQKNEFQKKFNNIIPKEKIFITRNGVVESRFNREGIVTKQRGKCIYTTTPFRGLDVLLDVWKEIHKQVPDSELHVYSSMNIYNQKETSETKEIFKKGRDIQQEYHITFHKPVTQKELADVMFSADVMLYPNHYPETSCITAMESIKAKTPIITTKLGALVETIHEGEGVLIEGDPHSDEYQKKFIEESVKMLTDDEYRKGFCLENRRMCWGDVALEWIAKFENLDKYVKIKQTEEGKMNINSEQYWDNIHKHDEFSGTEISGQLQRNVALSKYIFGLDNILDIGCARGSLLKHLYDKQIGASLTGAEISKEAIAIAKKNVPFADFIHISENPEELDAKDMDIIVVSHLIEHLEKPEDYINCWKKSLTEYGKMILVIPLDDEPYNQHLKIYSMSDVEELAKKVSKDYTIETRYQGWIYNITGRKAKEVILLLRFDENSNGIYEI